MEIIGECTRVRGVDRDMVRNKKSGRIRVVDATCLASGIKIKKMS